MKPNLTNILIAGSLLLIASDATAQHRRGPGGQFGVSFSAADARGDLGFAIDQGFGLELNGGLPIAADGHLRLRGDAGFLIYGIENIQYCDFGCRVVTDLTTTNSIAYIGVGPELVLARGDIQPYVHATAGMTWFLTTSSVDYNDGWGPEGETTNYSDHTIGFKYGGGIRFRASRRVAIDMGVTRHENGPVTYLTKGDIVDNDDGSITMFPNQSEADLLNFQLGLSFSTR